MAIIQSSLLSQVSLVGARVSLMLLAVVSWSMLRGAREGIAWGFIGGLALDFLSGVPLGSSAFTLTLVAYFASFGQLTIYRTSPLFPSVIAVTASILHDSIFLVVFRMTGHAVAWRSTLLLIALPTAFLGAFLMPVVYRALTWLDRRTKPDEIEL